MSILDQFNLAGKTALVTGCRRGIGRGIAEALASAGANIIGVSASLEGSGSAIEKAVTAMGRKFTAHSVEFSDRRAVTDFCAMLAAENITPDILINNAGTIKRKPASEISSDDKYGYGRPHKQGIPRNGQAGAPQLSGRSQSPQPPRQYRQQCRTFHGR